MSLHQNPKVGDLVRLDYGSYVIFVKVEELMFKYNKVGIKGYLVQYLDEGNNSSLPRLLHTHEGFYCVYDTCEILNSLDDIIVEIL